MTPFTTLTGIAAPMPLVNIDTDMMIPKPFLKTIARTGFGKNLFDRMRFMQQGAKVLDFVWLGCRDSLRVGQSRIVAQAAPQRADGTSTKTYSGNRQAN